MSLITYQPKNGLDFLFDQEGFFEGNLVNWDRASKVSSPNINVLEKENSFVIYATVPGIKKDDIELEITDDALNIIGKKDHERNGETENYWIREFTQGSFNRTFGLNEKINQDGITAKVENGILEVYLPKKEAVKPKKVKIN